MHGTPRPAWLAAALLVAGSTVATAAAQGIADGHGVQGRLPVRTATALADAAQRGERAAVLALLAGGADVDAAQGDGATALHWAAYRDDAEMAAALIRAGADVQRANRYGVTPLALAARSGSAEIIAQLLAAGADPNDPRQAVRAGETPLMQAARSGQVAAVEVLADAGADVDAQETWNGQPALMWAAAEGHAAVVEVLIERGANPVCAACHAQMDQLGFALENFDAIGEWRDIYASGLPIDASAEFPDGTTFDGPNELRQLLLSYADDFLLTVADRLLTYALGRGLEATDMPAVRRILRDAAPDGHRFASLVQGVVASLPFQMRTAQEGTD